MQAGTGIDRGGTGIGIGTGQSQRAGSRFGEAAGAGDSPGIGKTTRPPCRQRIRTQTHRAAGAGKITDRLVEAVQIKCTAIDREDIRIA